MLSKAAERSSKVRGDMLPESVERRRSLRMCRRVKVVFLDEGTNDGGLENVRDGTSL